MGNFLPGSFFKLARPQSIESSREGLTRSLAQELPKGLTTVAFNPGVIDTDMLRSCFGQSAGGYEKPAEWAKHAVNRFESLGPADNGKTILG